jgi:hypothetical protein
MQHVILPPGPLVAAWFYCPLSITLVPGGRSHLVPYIWRSLKDVCRNRTSPTSFLHQPAVPLGVGYGLLGVYS